MKDYYRLQYCIQPRFRHTVNGSFNAFPLFGTANITRLRFAKDDSTFAPAAGAHSALGLVIWAPEVLVVDVSSLVAVGHPRSFSCQRFEEKKREFGIIVNIVDSCCSN
jgi:hypothetical protein